MSHHETIDTRDAIGEAQKVALDSAHDRIRTLESALYSVQVACEEAAAVAARCQILGAKRDLDHITGIMHRASVISREARNPVMPSTATKGE